MLDLVRHGADRDPDGVAILGAFGERLTFADLLAEVTRIGQVLRGRGIGPTDTVLVSLPNGPDMLTAVIATMCAAGCAPLNPAYTLKELGDLVDDTGAVAVVAHNASAAIVELAGEHGLKVVEFNSTGSAAAERLAPQALAPALLLHTAGTTARPKQVPLSHSNLVAAASNVVDSLLLTPVDRCLNVMPLFHSHGLLGAALSTLSAGGSIVCTPGMDARCFVEWASGFGCTWYSAAPTVHQLALQARGDWDGFRFIRSASAPLPPQVAAELERRFQAPVIEVYGMTEAYQIAANPLPPGERRSGSVGRGTGTKIAVVDVAGAHLADGSDGEIVVRGPAVFGGYSPPTTADDETFVDGWFRTGDIGRMSTDGYLTITGRLKEQINRGGEKIAPREVEEALLDFPGIREVMAFAIPDPLLGEDLGVAVVASPDAEIDLATVRSFLSGRLAPFKVPKRVVVLESLPKSATGKLQRLAFAREHAAEIQAVVAHRSVERDPSALTLRRLALIWQEVLDLAELPQPADVFFDLGGTSLSVMELVIRIEVEFAYDLPLLDVLEVPALGDLAARLDQRKDEGEPHRPLLRPYRTGGSGGTVVLLPGQMGLAVGLNLIAEAIDTNVDVYLFDYPGHRGRERPLTSIDDLADALVTELERAHLDHNVAMYGNSLGGWVALEAARRLSDVGRPARFVGIGDMYSPAHNSQKSPLRPSFVIRVRNRLRRAVANLRRHSHLGKNFDKRTPPAVRRQQAVSRASEIARRSYVARPFHGNLLVVVAAEREPKFGATLGYERHTTGTIRTLRVAGGHSQMHREQARPIGLALTEMLS